MTETAEERTARVDAACAEMLNLMDRATAAVRDGKDAEAEALLKRVHAIAETLPKAQEHLQ